MRCGGAVGLGGRRMVGGGVMVAVVERDGDGDGDGEGDGEMVTVGDGEGVDEGKEGAESESV